MMRTTRYAVQAALVGVLLAACQPTPMPVPIEGDIRLLEGEWRGDYRSDDSGRFGTILFTLKSGTDTAHGEVIMIPRETQEQPRDPAQTPDVWRPRPMFLAVSFVRAAGNTVSGQLEPYRDPDCGCMLQTTFVGHVSADTLRGTYSSLHQEMGRRVSGVWLVVRLKE